MESLKTKTNSTILKVIASGYLPERNLRLPKVIMKHYSMKSFTGMVEGTASTGLWAVNRRHEHGENL
jgi:hypothetical protein